VSDALRAIATGTACLTNLTGIRNSVIAGLCGTVVHSLLALVHSKTGPLPEFQPNDDFQRVLSWLIGHDLHPGVAWLILFINGAVIWGFIFGQVYRFLPGKHAWQKGVFFAICVWLVMGFVFFPLVGRAIFAVDLGAGAAPAILLLVMLFTYSVTMSLVYHFLNQASV
jgi:hypothetical protein